MQKGCKEGLHWKILSESKKMNWHAQQLNHQIAAAHRPLALAIAGFCRCRGAALAGRVAGR